MKDAAALDAWIMASADLMKLPLDPAWLPAVRQNVDVTFRLAAQFDDFLLPDDAEPAPVYGA
jgi:hypothetical protein